MNEPTRGQVVEWVRDVSNKVVDWDINSKPITNADAMLMGAFGPMVIRLAALAYAKGQDAKRIELQTEMQRLTDKAQTAEKWRGIALARDGDGRTVQAVQQEAVADFLRSSGQYLTNDASRENAIAEAVAVEREACAATLEANAERCGPESMMRLILETNAAAIRARGNPRQPE